MAAICMAVYDTVENRRTELTGRTLARITSTVDFSKHRMIVVDNNSCQETKKLLRSYEQMFDQLITLDENVGTAKAINAAWKHRRPGEHVIKMDNDVISHTDNWVDLLEEAIERMPDTIGICCAKRKDLQERPDREGWAKSELKMLPQEPGQRNLVIEIVNHAMGTLQMYNWRLIDKMGGLTQMDGLYGFDDSLAAARCSMAGFISCFLHGIEIDHMDVQGDDGGYTQWKKDYAGEQMQKFHEVRQGVLSGEIPFYEPL